MNTIPGWLPLLMLFALCFPAAAQDGGQLWVRAFEDRDADGVRDANEPLLTEGVTVDLVRDGVVIASAVLEDAPYASQGLVGFQFLDSGEYTVRIAAGELTATTPDSVSVQVGGSGLPPVIEFGGQPLSATANTSTNMPDDLMALMASQDPETMRLLVAALGGVIVAGIVSFVGFLIYSLVLRPRYRAALKAAKLRATSITGSMRPVIIADEDQAMQDDA